MTRHGIISMLLALSLAGVTAAAETPPGAETLYKEAVMQETTARDLDKAIALYQQVLEQPDASRSVQSNTYLRLGICYEVLGKTEQAKTAWTRVVQDFADQRSAYLEAKGNLQTLEAESAKTAAVQTSTPRVVYQVPPTRWAFEWLNLSLYRTLDNKESFFPYVEGGGITLPHSLVYYLTQNVAVGVEGRRLFRDDVDVEPSGYLVAEDSYSYWTFYTLTRSLGYIAPMVRLEKRFRYGITPYAKVGPAAYRFHYEGDPGSETKWEPGLTGEAGLTLGWPRGFTLSVGYNVLGFTQPGYSGDVFGTPVSVPSMGWRWLGGPSFSLGFRW